jgi:Protein of unknown function (DUF4231)
MSQLVTAQPIKEPNETPPSDHELDQARELQRWYQHHAPKEQKKYYALEIAILLVSVSITVVGILMPGDGRWPALLGAVVVLLTALRALFRWGQNWIQYCEASTAMASDIRAYQACAKPYDDENTRAQLLITNVNDIETKAVKETSKMGKEKT